MCVNYKILSSPVLLYFFSDTTMVITEVSGNSAFLPSFTNRSEEYGDRVTLVLLFRDQAHFSESSWWKTKINVVYFRYNDIDLSVQPKNWKDPKLPSSSRRKNSLSPKTVRSEDENINLEDERKYRCRVYFEHQQTVIWWIELIVIGSKGCMGLNIILVHYDKPRITQPKIAKIKQWEIDIRNENMTI